MSLELITLDEEEAKVRDLVVEEKRSEFDKYHKKSDFYGTLNAGAMIGACYSGAHAVFAVVYAVSHGGLFPELLTLGGIALLQAAISHGSGERSENYSEKKVQLDQEIRNLTSLPTRENP